MKQLLQMIDIHIVVIGAIVSAVCVGLVSVITFVPGDPRLIPCLMVGLLPLLLFLEPVIITRTIDRKKKGGAAVSYFGMNTLVAVAFGALSGLLIFGMLPRESHQTNNRQNKASLLTPVPPPAPAVMTVTTSTCNRSLAPGQA